MAQEWDGASVRIDNVPDEVLAVHRRRARAAAKSLDTYLLQWLVDGAGRELWDEALVEAAAPDRRPLELAELNRIIRADRAGH